MQRMDKNNSLCNKELFVGLIGIESVILRSKALLIAEDGHEGSNLLYECTEELSIQLVLVILTLYQQRSSKTSPPVHSSPFAIVKYFS